MREVNRDGSWEETRQTPNGKMVVVHYTVDKQVHRDKMISRIEGYFGCLGVWYQWDTPEIEKLHAFVVKNFLKY